MRLTSTGTAVPTAAASARPQAPAPLAPWQAVLVAIAGGLALAAAFPPAGLWPLAPLGPALLAISLWRQPRLRTALTAGLAFGLALFFPLVSWLVNVAWYAWIALAVLEAVIIAVLAAGQWLLLRMRAWPLAVAGWWVLCEAVRSRWPWEGFPWGRLAMSQATSPAVGWAVHSAIALPVFFFVPFSAVTIAGVAAIVLLAVKGGDGSCGFLVRGHFHEPKALAAAFVPIIDDLGGNNRTMCSEQRFEFRSIHLVAQVPDIQLLTHLESPWDMGRPRPEVKWFFPGQIERGRHGGRCGREKTDTEERKDTRDTFLRPIHEPATLQGKYATPASADKSRKK